VASALRARARGRVVPLRRAACVSILLALPGCRDAAERRAAEVADLRDRAADGLAAIEAYCTTRDSVLAASQRGAAGAELALEQTLYELDRLADYCEEFRFHTHDAHTDTTPTAAPTVPAHDSGAHTPSRE
jgi:hypothetical protein